MAGTTVKATASGREDRDHVRQGKRLEEPSFEAL